MQTRRLAAVIGISLVVAGAALAAFKREQIMHWFEPPGSRVILVQYVNEQGHQKSRSAGQFDSFDECEKAREHLPIGGGFVLGGVCVRESQWKTLNP